MKIVKIKGGLGNQLFQYAFARLIQAKTGEEVKIDMFSLIDRKKDSNQKSVLFSVFVPRLFKMNLALSSAETCDIAEVCRFRHRGDPRTLIYKAGILFEYLLNPNYYFEKNRGYVDPSKIQKYSYFDGYWQSWRYVDEILPRIQNELQPKSPLHDSTLRMIDEVSGVNSVFMGVRKGDYSNSKRHFGVFTNDYYQKAMRYIAEHVENPVFYVFSNDISWVKNNIDFAGKTVIFREPEDVVDDFEDLFIMASCRHSIIINSTYHWWGARLNNRPDKIVVAPEKWFFDDSPINIIPPYWVRLKP